MERHLKRVLRAANQARMPAIQRNREVVLFLAMNQESNVGFARTNASTIVKLLPFHDL
jgi:hypothetical protein